jgi:hypothetical protein
LTLEKRRRDTDTITNSSPFGVHVVDLYVYNPATNSLVAHYYVNSTEDFDYWVGQGSTMSVPLRFIWAASTSYLVTVRTDTGVTAQLTAMSLPLPSNACPTGSLLTQITPAQICSTPTTVAQVAASPVTAFSSNANTCTDVTSGTIKMMGLGVTYTTGSSSSGGIYVILTFDAKSPAVSNVNSKWQLAYGTGTAPACNAAVAGTTVGKQYIINTEAATAGGMSQTIGFTITGLSSGTQYWFDVQVTDSSNAVWTYSNRTISVMDIMPADFVHSNTAFSSNANSCGRNTATTLMAGFASSYTTTSFGGGNIQVVLTFNVASPAKDHITTRWQVAYGTGTAPACNAASTGTTVDNVYTLRSQAAVLGGSGQSTGFTLVGLSPPTTYWFDVQATDSSTAVWTYSNPQISVVELP